MSCKFCKMKKCIVRPKTRGDMVRAMSDEELLVNYIVMYDKFNPWDKEEILEWLREEVTE